MVSIFNDGEPIDPKKLEDLQTQISKLQAESAVQEIATAGLQSSLRSITYHSQAGIVEVGAIDANKVHAPVAIPVKWSQDYDTSSIKTVVILRSKSPKVNIRYSIHGTGPAPTLYVWSESITSAPLVFDWISVAGKISKT